MSMIIPTVLVTVNNSERSEVVEVAAFWPATAVRPGPATPPICGSLLTGAIRPPATAGTLPGAEDGEVLPIVVGSHQFDAVEIESPGFGWSNRMREVSNRLTVLVRLRRSPRAA
jgi:hypothetical protein